ncbi:MAG: zinc-ribbon domain-containing protein [Bacteroidales bacterium]|nr:zinc-ribbon domain-containing protein [Bacteroidales bacterium]
MIYFGGVQDKVADFKYGARVEHCPHCHNDSRWIVEKNARWISVFVIPICPLNSTYYYYCPICHDGRRIEEEDYESLG